MIRYLVESQFFLVYQAPQLWHALHGEVDDQPPDVAMTSWRRLWSGSFLFNATLSPRPPWRRHHFDHPQGQSFHVLPMRCSIAGWLESEARRKLPCDADPKWPSNFYQQFATFDHCPYLTILCLFDPLSSTHFGGSHPAPGVPPHVTVKDVSSSGSAAKALSSEKKCSQRRAKRMVKLW